MDMKVPGNAGSGDLSKVDSHIESIRLKSQTKGPCAALDVGH